MKRRWPMWGAVGVCAVLVASFAPPSVSTKQLRTVGGPVANRQPAPTATPDSPGQVAASADDATRHTSGAEAAAGPKVARPGPPRAPRNEATVTRGPHAPTTALGLKGPLHTEGNRILDADRRPVVLRGIQRVALQQPGRWPAITDAEIGHAQAWGASVIRLPLGEAYSDPTCSSQYIPTYFDTLDAVVNSITSRGMVALLDLAFVTRVPCGESFRWRMADKPGSIAFWEMAAARYKANPLVAFDLYNEPHDITDAQWRSGGELVDQTPTGSVRWTAAGMQELYDAVRSTGATNLITVSVNGYGGDPSPVLDGNGIVGSNFVYAAHLYTCSKPDEAWCTANPENKRVHVGREWASVASRYPVTITEFGWPDDNDGTYNASVIGFAQSQHPVWGWIAFAWDGTTKGGFNLVADLNTYQPSRSGAPVKAALSSPP